MIFEPDVLIPAQFDYRRDARWSGERQLLLAIIADAVAVATGSIRMRDSERDRARAWINSRAFGIMTFEWICEMTGLSAEYLRKGVYQAKATGIGALKWHRRNARRRPEVPRGDPRSISARRRREIAMMGVESRKLKRSGSA